MRLGEVIGTGVRSTVYACGAEHVMKVPLPSTPDIWIRYEAEFTTAVHQLGLPVPAVVELTTYDDRLCVVYERVDGPSMWARVREQPADAEEMGRSLAELHHVVLSTAPPMTLPWQRDRLAAKIRRAARLTDPALIDALDAVPARGAPLRLCHGDMHPGNVIMSARGPVVLDWFDASRGVPLADVARSSVLMGAGGAADAVVPHLPGAAPAVLRAVHDGYVAAVTPLLGLDLADLRHAIAVQAAARIAEGISAAELLSLWRASA